MQPLLEGDLKKPLNFTGRESELTRLNLHWLPRSGLPLLVIQGLAGLGKTALAAECIHLWHTQFTWVLAVQARGVALTAELFYQQMDSWLIRESNDYREACREDEYVKIYLKDYPYGERYERMRGNFLERLRDESILLVIDNFETCLFENGDCRDKEWTALLSVLAMQLTNTSSRVLMTTRHYPKVLEADKRCLWLSLGTLPLNEARVFLWAHSKLRSLWNQDAAGQALVEQVLNISRGHPLIMQRLADLADDVDELQAALAVLKDKGYKNLPDLFKKSADAVESEQFARCGGRGGGLVIRTFKSRYPQSAVDFNPNFGSRC